MDAYQAGALLGRALIGDGLAARRATRAYVSGNPFQLRTNAENVRGVIRQIAAVWREQGAGIARMYIRAQAGHIGGPYAAVLDGVPIAEALAESLPPDGGDIRQWGERVEFGSGGVLEDSGRLGY